MSQLFLQLVRFAGIGFLNTAVDFAVLNTLMFYFGIFRGTRVGIFSIISFGVAVVHSYVWNKYWAFRQDAATRGFTQNLGQFIGAAALGVAVFLFVLFGAGNQYTFSFYVAMLFLLLVGELGLWKIFQLKKLTSSSEPGRQFFYFLVISVGGALINFAILKFGTTAINPQFGINQELWTNFIKILATAIALIWNFLGYRIFVFKN